jgi:hypothetical protein
MCVSGCVVVTTIFNKAASYNAAIILVCSVSDTARWLRYTAECYSCSTFNQHDTAVL